MQGKFICELMQIYYQNKTIYYHGLYDELHLNLEYSFVQSIMKETHKNKSDTKDIYDIAKQIEVNKTKQVSTEEQAKRIINSYRKVQDVNANYNDQIKKPQIKGNLQLNKTSIQPSSTYASKIKQTLKQLNANKTKQYQKIIKPTSKKSIQNNESKNQHQQRLKRKSSRKINDLLQILVNRKCKKTFDSFHSFYEQQIENDFSMARRYRLFRMFNLWKEETVYLKLQNQKRRKQEGVKDQEGANLATQFRKFVTCKKVLKSWHQITKRQQKKRKYERQLKQIQKVQKRQHELQQLKQNQKEQVENSLQNKLKGFLDGLKNKIQNKDRLKTIKQKTEESAEAIIPQTQREHQPENQNDEQQQEQINQNQVQDREQNSQEHEANNQHQQNIPKKPLTNQELEQKRKQLQQRSKTRKKMLQKLKKQKQTKKNKEQLEKQQLQKVIQEEQKKVKQEQYRQYLKNKQAQQQWQQKQNNLNQRAEKFNRLRIIRYYGFDLWKNIKIKQIQNTCQVKSTIQRVLRSHLSKIFFESLVQNLQQKLQTDYEAMRIKYQRKLKKKAIIGFKQQKSLQLQKKQEYTIFHQVHTKKIFLKAWTSILQDLRLENFEWQRPRMKKSNDYHKIMLMIKTIRALRQNRIESRKTKNIEDHKNKIKKKIDSIISQNISINYNDFL